MAKITWFIILLSSVVMLTFIFYSAVANTAPPILVDKQTGKYLGNLSSNPYDPNSTSNPYGQYGSKYSPDSINNPHGQYGSKYSNDSPNNPYATNPPEIMDTNGY
tara:strand:+ start:404 stop:718 length:315 start_codon:yes stop_codon:yes gene_type:complete